MEQKPENQRIKKPCNKGLDCTNLECKFLHVPRGEPVVNEEWKKKMYCKWGDKCKGSKNGPCPYSHDPAMRLTQDKLTSLPAEESKKRGYGQVETQSERSSTSSCSSKHSVEGACNGKNIKKEMTF